MLKVSNLVLRYGGRAGRGIGPLSLSLRRGECLGLLGPSGCGKSTILRVIAGLLPRPGVDHSEGLLQWDPRDDGTTLLGGLDACPVSLMFQHTVLLPHMTVMDNVLLPFMGNPQRLEGARRRAQQLLDEVGLTSEAQLLPEALSGGMRTRTALARALVVRPMVLLLDEPFSGLDIAIRESAYRVIEVARKRDGTTVVFVSHDLEEAWRLCERAVVMNNSATGFTEIANAPRMAFGEFRDLVLSAMDYGNNT